MDRGRRAAGQYLRLVVTLIAQRNKVREAMSSVDVHLTQRHDLVPNVMALATRYMTHERDLAHRGDATARSRRPCRRRVAHRTAPRTL